MPNPTNPKQISTPTWLSGGDSSTKSTLLSLPGGGVAPVFPAAPFSASDRERVSGLALSPGPSAPSLEDRFYAVKESVPITIFWRLMSRVDIQPGSNGCWLWTGPLNNVGYGPMSSGGRHAYVHRVAYEMAFGPIPEGLELDHLCRTPRCVRPNHLEPVEHRINSLRGESPGARAVRTGLCARGHSMAEAYIRPDGRGRICRKCFKLRYWLRRHTANSGTDLSHEDGSPDPINTNPDAA